MKFISHALSEPEIPKLSNYIQLPIGIHHNCVFLLLFSSFLQVITTQTKCSHLNDIGVSGGTRNFLTSLPAISFPFARTMSGEGKEGGGKGGQVVDSSSSAVFRGTLPTLCSTGSSRDKAPREVRGE